MYNMDVSGVEENTFCKVCDGVEQWISLLYQDEVRGIYLLDNEHDERRH